jgi:hypothetical protein
MSGRPLRFLGGTLVIWVGIRTVMLWPALDSPAALPKLLIPTAAAEEESGDALRPTSVVAVAQPSMTAARDVIERPVQRPTGKKPYVPASVVAQAHNDRTSDQPAPSAMQLDRAREVSIVPPIPGRLPSASRWSGSAWLVLRDGRGLGSSFGGSQLGGAQTGVRIAYAVDRSQRVALVSRLTSPLHGTGREASIGVEWRPTPLPIRFIVEHRFALDGGKGGPAVGVIAGTGPAPLARGLDLETYGQAGVIRRDRTEPFAEGAARLTRRVTHVGHLKLDLGIGAWGAAQRGAQRVDVGPSIGVTLPVANRTIRAIGDWRQRVAGHASPGSGPTLTIGADF